MAGGDGFEIGKQILPATEISAEPTTFTLLVLRDPEPARAPETSLRSGNNLRLIFGGAVIELTTDIPAVRTADIVHALGASS